VLISGADDVTSETGTATAGEVEGVEAGCGAGDWVPVEEGVLLDDCGVVVNASPVAAGEAA
jgi:hypothetical protein